jgi:lysophospholipase L1-like esterase
MKKHFLLFIVLVFATCSFAPKEVKWVAIGDSITYLNNNQKETDNRVYEGYLTQVVNSLPFLKYSNLGRNGWTASRIAENIENISLKKGDVYSVFLGTNDWWAGRPIGQISDYQKNTGFGTLYGSYRIIIDKIKRLNPEAPIILITPMKRVDFVYIANFNNNAYGSYKEKNGQTLEQHADAIMEIGKLEKLKVVDLYHHKSLDYKNLVKFKRLKNPKTGVYQNYKYPDFIDIPFDAKKDEYPYPKEAMNMTYDGLHPSDKGNKVIAKELIKIMKDY